jgi:hypothetical protein
MNNQTHPDPIATVKSRWPVRITMCVLPWIIAGALFVTNMSTLLSDKARSTGCDRVLEVMKALSMDSLDLMSRRKSQPPLANEMKKADDLVEQNMMLTERRKALESTIAKLQLENTEIKIQKNDVTGRLQKLQLEHTDLQNRHVAVEKERIALKEMSVKRAKAVKTVADRISRKLSVHAGELIAELPLRAAPYIGVFTLVTGTTLDIRSDCELANTLNTLVLEHQEAPLDTHAVCQYMDKIPPAARVWSEVKSHASSLTVRAYQNVERLGSH